LQKQEQKEADEQVRKKKAELLSCPHPQCKQTFWTKAWLAKHIRNNKHTMDIRNQTSHDQFLMLLKEQMNAIADMSVAQPSLSGHSLSAARSHNS
jgi:hypothetical protein